MQTAGFGETISFPQQGVKHMKRVLGLTTTIALVLAVGLPAQAPNFAGTWKLDPGRSEMPQMGRRGGGGPGGGMGDIALTITQTAADLTVDRQGGMASSKAVYKLDGSESLVPGGRGGDAKAKARIEGSTLVIESTRAMGEMTMTTREVWSIDASGNLVQESTTQTPGGERKSKLVFTKVTG